MAIPGYIAATIPAKVDRVSGTTLFHLAMIETGNPLQWVPIAQLNNLVDPWITAQADVLIPPVLPAVLRVLPEIGGLPYVKPPPPIVLSSPFTLIMALASDPPLISTSSIPLAPSLVLSPTLPTMVHAGSPSMTPAVASLALSAPAPTINLALGMTPDAASLTLTGQSSKTPVSVQPGVRSLTLTGNTPSVLFNYRPTVASLTLTGVAPTRTVTASPSLKPNAASLKFTGSTPDSPVYTTWSGPTSDLVNRWQLDAASISGTTALDLVGSNNGTINGTIGSLVSPPSGAYATTALPFDGTTNYISLASSPVNTAGPWTIGFWINLTDTSYNPPGSFIQCFINFFTGSGHSWCVRQGSGSLTNISVGDSNLSNAIRTTGAPLSDGNWVHFAVTYDGTTRKFYVNGSNVSTTSAQSLGATSSAITIGSRSSTTGMIEGAMYQVVVYNDVLSATDVSNLYAAG